MGTLALTLNPVLGLPGESVAAWTTATGADAIGTFTVTLTGLNHEVGDVSIARYDNETEFSDAVLIEHPLTSDDIAAGFWTGSTATRVDGTWYISSRELRGDNYFSDWQDTPDSEVIAATPPETDTIISYNGFTFSFFDTTTGLPKGVEWGQFILGDPYFIADPTVNVSVDPAWNATTLKNGAMINPSSTALQGYDNQAGTWSQKQPFGNRQVLPVIMTAGQSLCCGRSKIQSTGGASEFMSDTVVLTCLAAHPASPSTTFRPSYAGTDKTLYTTADIVGTLPSLAIPAGRTPPSIAAVASGLTTNQAYGYADYFFISANNYGARSPLAYPNFDHATRSASGSLMAANNMDAYRPQGPLGRMAVKLLVDHAERETTRNRLLQYAIDLRNIQAFNSDAWSTNAGFGVSRLFILAFARVMFDDASFLGSQTVTTSIGTFAKHSEVGYTYLGNATVEYPGGIPLLGSDRNTLEATKSVTGVSRTNPVVMNVPTHGSNAGGSTTCRVAGTGVPELDGNDYIITRIDANNFSLNGVDGTSHTPYVSGGTVQLTRAGSNSQDRDPDGLLMTFGYLGSDGATRGFPIAAQYDLLNRGQYAGNNAPSFAAFALAAYNIPGMEAAINHPAFFAMAKRWRTVFTTTGLEGGTGTPHKNDIYGNGGSGNGFCWDMWQLHGY